MKRYIKPFEPLLPDTIPQKVDDLDEIVNVKVSKFQLSRINRLLQNYNKHQEQARKKNKNNNKIKEHDNIVNSD